MKRRRTTAEEESSFDLVERAFHLLRTTPIHITARFYLGSIPFVLGLLFFLVDMGSNPFAGQYCSASAFGMGLLYIWMRTWQSLFCQGLNSKVKNSDPSDLNPRTVWQFFKFHLIYSSWAAILLPVSAILAIPFGWVYAYFNNLCMTNPCGSDFKESAARARSLSMLWPKQNHLLITLLFSFSIVIFINIGAALVYFPGLLKSLCGIESSFSRSFHWIFTPTFFGIACGLTYLAIEPLVKAAYVLRCHTCESIQTGEDLLIELKRLPPVRRSAVSATLALMIVCCSAIFSPLRSAPLSDNPPSAINVPELDAAIDHVMKSPEFTWRMPNILPEDKQENGFFEQFFAPIQEWLEKTTRSFVRLLDRFFEWMNDWFKRSPDRQHKDWNLNPALLKNISLILLLILIGILAVVLFRVFRNRFNPPESIQEAVPSTEVDIDDENITATLLEEEEWIELARQLVAAGELRKAMRAWFLAGIACLARQELLQVRQSKSNLEYRRELIRRARRLPDLPPLFTENIGLFERAWYGLHSASMQDLNQLEQNTERMRRDVKA
ncbi:DUF4129 domain-containing protein [Tichowtungia aerotolerans]|uniref:DUF4129 domain-containing protein n=1 Tax=Tichowtungia aerotolerans TaxID=2697043 RepID=A0A6P1M5X6_9BACT|nr:DUF4129 domain-containing protein [Tichowtungia aerotolerans]QHI68403.1 DUF4129 domain-containing protein [Tichowtungia aerotolerans]